MVYDPDVMDKIFHFFLESMPNKVYDLIQQKGGGIYIYFIKLKPDKLHINFNVNIQQSTKTN